MSADLGAGAWRSVSATVSDGRAGGGISFFNFSEQNLDTPRRAQMAAVVVDDTLLRANNRYRICADGFTGRFSPAPSYRVDIERISAVGSERVARLKRGFSETCKVVETPLEVGDILLWKFRLDSRETLRPDFDNNDTHVYFRITAP